MRVCSCTVASHTTLAKEPVRSKFRPKHAEGLSANIGTQDDSLRSNLKGGRAANDAALKRQVLTAGSGVQCLSSRSRFYAKADWLLRLVRRFHQLSNRVENLLDRVIMCVQLEL